MSHYTKLMLWSAIAVESAYVGFFILMTDGLALGERSPKFMSFAVVGFLVAVAVVILLQQWLSGPASRSFPDEREEALDAKAERFGAGFLEAGVFVIATLAIYEAAAGPNSLGSYSLTRPEGLVFAMITISSLAGFARMILAIIQDRRV
ncbi:MAG: hypothetical protein WA782_14475 [Sulfitobacter sp.]